MKTKYIHGIYAMIEQDKVILFNPYLMTSDIVPLVDYDIEKSIRLEREKLLKQKVLINGAKDSALHNLSDFFVQRDSQSTQTLYFTDAMSYNCNFDCVYCMQQNTYRDVIRLSAEQRVDVWETILHAFGASNIALTLFGGEPFFDLEYVEDLLNLARERQLHLDYIGAVTNGSIVNSKVISLIKSFDIKILQITLDGTEKVHNQRRVPRNDKEGYSNILDNIDRLMCETDVMIIINTVLDKQNVKCYSRMIDEVITRFGKYILSDYPRIVFNLGNECHPYMQSEYTKNNMLVENEQDIFFKNLLYVLECGGAIYSPLPSPRCISTSVNEFVLAPNGDIYRCISGLGNKEFLIIKYKDYMEDIGKLVIQQAMIKKPNRIRACDTCVNYPLYNGGCNYNMIVENKDSSCQKLLFEENIDQYMKVISLTSEIAPNIFRLKEAK